jgi:hypothetical protein
MSNDTNETTTETKKTSREAQLERLRAAGKKVETERAERKTKTVKGGHLKDAFLEKAKLTDGLNVEEKSGFYKITGPTKGRTVYLATKGGRVDLSGFSVDHPAVVQISAEEAKEKHIGKVRGQLDFEQDDEAVTAAFSAALVELSAEVPEEPKPEKPKKEKKAPRPPKAEKEPSEETEAGAE